MPTTADSSSVTDELSQPLSPNTSSRNDLPLPHPGGDHSSTSYENYDTSAARERLEHVLQSDIGIATLLNRLKQSVTSARDFSTFLKDRSILEEKHAQGLKRLSKASNDQIRRPDSRQGSFAYSYEHLVRIHDRMADHGIQFANALWGMSEELLDLATNSERQRKHWKQSGLNAEKRVQEAEAAMEKAKAKCAALADQYDRARTGEQTGGKFGLKKSGRQAEEDIFRKFEAADSDYAGKVLAAQQQQQELLTTLRPQVIQALQEVVKETDAGLTAQIQKFAALTERLLLGYGLCVTPLKNPTTAINMNASTTTLNHTLNSSTTNVNKSLREVASEIHNERDFDEFVLGFSNKAGTRANEIKYEKHPSLLNKQRQESVTSQYSQVDPYGNYSPNVQGRQVSGVAPYADHGGDAFAGPNAGLRGPAGAQAPGPGPGPGPVPGPGYGAPGPQHQKRPSYPPGMMGGPLTSNDPAAGLGGDRFGQPTSGVPAQSYAAGAQGGHRRQQSLLNETGPAPMNPNNMDPVRYTLSSLTSREQLNGSLPANGRPHERSDSTGPGPMAMPPAGYSTDSDRDRYGRRAGIAQPTEPAVRGGAPPTSPGPGQLPGLRPAGMGLPTGPGQDFQHSGPPAAQPISPSQQSQSAFGSLSSPRLAQGPGLPRQDSYHTPASASAQTPTGPPYGPYGASTLPRQNTNASWLSSASVGQNISTTRLPPGQRGLPPLNPVFGVALETLFAREGSAVPTIVYQCIQAVDLFGLDEEGIYRTSGSAHHIMDLRQQFDHDSSMVDFRSPAAFYNDISSVTTLLKHFLRDLPDPLLTTASYQAFISAARVEDSLVRRDSVHALVNALPDPHYATLRVLSLHLWRIAQRSDKNKMTISNLAIVFAPTLMGVGQGSGGVSDAGWQAKVVETILGCAYDLFDDDESGAE